MRLLLNENIPLAAVESLRQIGDDVVWARKEMPGAADAQVLQKAMVEDRLLVTFDKDFGELVYRTGAKASVGIVLFRLPALPASGIAQYIARALHGRNDWRGNFSVVEPGRIRMVPLPKT